MADPRHKNKALLDKLEIYTKVNEKALNSQLTKQSSLLYRVGVMKADSEFAMDIAESKLELIRAKLDKKHRKKKDHTTETELKKKIEALSEVVTARKSHIEAKYKFNVCKVAFLAMTSKGDQLKEMAYNYRKELSQGKSSIGKESKHNFSKYTKKKGKKNGKK